MLSPGDIVRGHVILKTPLALGVQITALVASCKARELSRLDVRGLVQHEDLSAEEEKCEGVLEEMEVEDCVQGQVREGEREGCVNGIHLQLWLLGSKRAILVSPSAPSTCLSCVLPTRACSW